MLVSEECCRDGKGGHGSPCPYCGRRGCLESLVSARALGNAIELYDPAVVSLYGAPFRDEALFTEVAQRVESNERPCEIRRSGLDPELPALGGAAIALQRFIERGGVVEK